MGILKQLLFYLPILAFIVWQIVSLNRDPELRQPRRDDDRGRDADDSGDPGHTERQQRPDPCGPETPHVQALVNQ